jgi:hypothetical protein
LERLPWVSADWPRPPNIVLLNDIITLQRPYSLLCEHAIVPAPKFYIEQTGRHGTVAFDQQFFFFVESLLKMP